MHHTDQIERDGFTLVLELLDSHQVAKLILALGAGEGFRRGGGATSRWG